MKATITRNYWRFGRKLITGALAAAVVATLGASQAQAADSKLYPGSMCVQWQGPKTTLNGSRIFNPGTTVASLDCPVIHDSLNTPILGGHVDVLCQRPAREPENDPNTRVCANLVSVSQLNFPVMTVRSTGRKCSLGSAAGRSERLSFGGLPADANAHYYYSVSLPPIYASEQSAIISYRVDEK